MPDPAHRQDVVHAPQGTTVVHVTTVPLSLHTFLTGQARFIHELGFSVHAVSSGGPDLVRFARQEGVPVHVVEMTRRISPLRDLVALVRLWRAFRRIGPTIVHAHSPKGGLLGMLAAVLARVPVRIYHIRGLPHATAGGLRRIVLVASERVSSALAHRVLAVSPSMKQIAVRDAICPAEKIWIPLGGSGNGVDATGRFRPAGAAARARVRAELGIPPEALVIGFVGRIGRDKGIVDLADAWTQLRGDSPRLHLLLVGGEEGEDPLPAEVTGQLRLDPRVRLTGAVPSTERMYGAMDVVALPSYREGMPNVALEAAAAALPIVATRIPGCVDAVQDGVTGTLVPPHDAGALRAALQRYLGDEALRLDHGAAGRRRVLAEFDQVAVWRAIAAEYGRLLQGHGAAGAAAALPPP